MLLDDIKDYLSSGGITTTIVKGLMPPMPDDVVVIYEYGGAAPSHTMNGSAGQAVAEWPRIQVVVRGKNEDYATPRTTANAIWKLLDGMPTRTINGVAYKWGEAVQSPFALARDPNGRVSIACNYQIVKELST